MKQDFTIVVFSADKSGLLHRVTTAFTKRHINIESLTVCKCEVPGISRYTITCLLYTSPSPRDQRGSRMPSSA